MTKLRKFFVSSVMVMTVVVMSGLTAPMATNAAASAGDLIKKDGLSAVYYLGEDGKRYVFPNESTYKSWYSDFSGVVTVSADELASYPLGANVVVRPGTFLVKITTDPKVYAVESNGTLRHVQTEADAIALYGANWAQRVIDVADSFFTNYTIGTPLASNEVPEGTLVQKSGEGNIYYYDGTDYRLIEDEVAFLANRFQFGHVITYNNFTASGSTITGAEAGITKTSQSGATGPVVTGSGLVVSLSSNTPASQNIPSGSSVEFLKFNMTAANDGPVNVSSIKLTADGLSDAQNIDSVTFYDGNMKIGTSKNINSDREAIFNFANPIYVAAGTTKTLTVKATIAVNTGTYGLGIVSASDIISSGATVTGSFPINSNLMSAVSASLGTLQVTSATAITNTVSFGEDNVLLSEFALRAGSNEDALLQSITLYNSGTNSNDIVDNLKLIIDGEEVSTGVYADRYVTFTLNNYKIEKSDTISVEVRGDIGTTSNNDTIKMYIKESLDVVAVGATHGFGLTLTNTVLNSAISTVTIQTGDFSIDMDKAITPARDVKADTKDVVLATIKMTSNGENATLTGIANTGFYVTYGTGTTTQMLENVKLVDKSTGGIYDLTAATSSTSTQLTLDDEISLVKGVTKTFELKADILTAAPENQTFAVTLAGSAMTIEGDVSGANISNITPSSVTGSIITVKAASLTVTPTALVSTNVVGGANSVIVYQAKVKAGTADGVKIQSVKLTSATSSAATSAFTDNNITKLSLWLNGKLLKEVSNQIANDSTTTNGTITFSSLNTANYTIPAGMEYDLVVMADFASSLIAGDFKLKVDAPADWTVRSVDGNKVVTPNDGDATSRVVTAATKGTLTVSLVTTDSKASRDSYVLAGSESEAGRYLGELKFVTAKEAIKVETLTLTATSSSSAFNDDIESIKLVTADGVVIASANVTSAGHATFDPFNVVFDADKSTSLFIAVEAKGINVNEDPTSTADHGDHITYALGAVTAKGNLSGETINVTNSGGVSKKATIVGSKLISITNAMSDGTLTGGTGKILGKYTLVFDNGVNRDNANEAMKAALSSIKITFSNTATVTAPYLYIEGHASNKATSTGVVSGSVTFTDNLANLVDSGEIDGSVTIVVAGQVTTSGENQYVQTSLASLGGDVQYYVDVDNSSASNGSESITSMLINVNDVNGATLSN